MRYLKLVLYIYILSVRRTKAARGHAIHSVDPLGIAPLETRLFASDKGWMLRLVGLEKLALPWMYMFCCFKIIMKLYIYIYSDMYYNIYIYI